MASEDTNVMAKGTSTSEFKIAAAMVIIGLVLDTAGVVIAQATEMFPNSTWLGMAMLVVGMLTKIVTTLKYISSRTAVKESISTMATDLPTPEAKIDFLRGKKGPQP